MPSLSFLVKDVTTSWILSPESQDFDGWTPHILLEWPSVPPTLNRRQRTRYPEKASFPAYSSILRFLTHTGAGVKQLFRENGPRFYILPVSAMAARDFRPFFSSFLRQFEMIGGVVEKHGL